MSINRCLLKVLAGSPSQKSSITVVPRAVLQSQQRADSGTNTSLIGFAGPKKKLLPGDVLPQEVEDRNRISVGPVDQVSCASKY